MVNLRWFRKHQKVMLVVFGVILMGVFVIGGVTPFMQGSGGQASGRDLEKFNQTIVQWSGGKLSRGQLQRLLELHYATMNFQEALLRDGFARSSQGIAVRPISPIPEASLEAADRAIFERYAMSEYARKNFGMVVSDSAVYDFLQSLSQSDGSQQYLVSVARKTSPHVGYGQIHEYLKMELLAQRLDEILGESIILGGGGAAPASVLDAWQAFLQNEKQIECAVEEFDAADFLPQITEEPSTVELRALYNEGKFADVDPIGQQPGFKLPRKVRVEYVSADSMAFLDLAIQDVTPEQVLAEYNRLVEAKDPLVMEKIPAADSEPMEKLEDEKLQEDPPPGESDKPGDSKDPAPVPPTEKGDAPPGDEPPKSDDDGKSNEVPKSSDDGNESDPKSNETPSDESGGGLSQTLSNVQFVSRIVKNPQESADSANPQEEKPQDAPPAETPDPALSTPTQEPENKDQEKPPQQPEANPADPAVTQDPAVAPTDPPQQPTDRPKKLDAALELAIKQRLKREEANTKLLLAVEKAREAMNDYSLALSDYESNKDLPADERSPEPTPIDLNSFAADNHLRYGLTELCTYEDLIKDPIGMAFEFQQDPTTGQFGTKRAADEIFVNFDRKQLRNIDEINSGGGHYLYWLTEKIDSRVPSFEESRNDVINFWKKRKSVELAKAAAEKACDEVRASGKTLIELHPELAKLSGGFRWFQSSFNQMDYGTPRSVKNAGEEFMSTAFSLGPNELGVALNDDRTAAYAIQLVTEDPRTIEQLRDQYLDHIATVRQVVPSATNNFYNRKSVARLLNSLNDELKVEWVAY